jgi:hypothetical protein
MVDPLEYRYFTDTRGLFNIEDIFYYEYKSDGLLDKNVDEDSRTIKHLPFYGRVYKKIDRVKDNDFIFSCFFFTKQRSKEVKPPLERMIESITSSGIKNKVYFLDYGKSKDYTTDAIPFLEYDNWVKRSKYTLIMPSGNPKHYTWWLRTYQAMINRCVPLIHKNCNFERMNQPCHKDVYDFIKRNDLMVDETNIVEKIKSLDYDRLARKMNDICKTKFSEDSIKDFYGNLDRLIK